MSSFQFLPDYARFLLHFHLNQLVPENISMVRQANIPLMKYYDHLDEATLTQLTRESLGNFLKEIAENRALASAMDTLERWRADELPNVRRDHVHFRDIVMIYSIRKGLFMQALGAYTSEMSLAIAIMAELEAFYVQVEEAAFGIFLEIQQDKLRQELDFSNSLVNNSVDGILAFDRELRITEWNPAMERIRQIKRTDILGKKIFEAFPAYENTEEGQATLKVLTGENIFIPEKPFLDRKGYYEAHVSPLFGKNNEVIGGISLIHDVTHRRETEDRLRENQEELQTALEELREQLEKREEVEAALRTSEQQFRLLAENSSDMISVHTLEGIYTYVSPACEKLLGYRSEELIGRMPFDFFHPDDIPEVQQKYAQMRQSGESGIVSYRLKNQQGQYIWIESNLQLKTDPQTGEINQLQMSSRDVTRRKEAETLLLTNKARLREAQAMAQLGYWEQNLVTGEIVWTREMYHLFGLEEGLPISLELFRSCTHPDDRQGLREWQMKWLQFGDPGLHEHRVVRPDGQIRYLRSKGQVDKDKEGRNIRFKGIAQDITEIREAEDQISRQQHFIQQIADASPDIIGVISLPDLQPIYANHEITHYLGYTPEQVLQMTKEERENLIHPDDKEKRIAYFQGFAQADEKEIRELEYRVKDTFGEWHCFCLRGKVFTRNPDGTPSQVVTMAQDITTRKAAEARLQESQYLIERITDTTPNLLYIYNMQQNRNVYANRELFRQLGYTLEQVQEMGADFLPKTVHPEDYPEIGRSFRELFVAKDTDIVEVEYRIRAANGQWRWLFDRATVFSRHADGQVLEVLGTSQDITDRKLIELELHEKNRELNQALEELRSTQDQLLLLNEDLEFKVEERTRELASSEEELRQTLEQAVELNNRLAERENFLSSVIDQSPFSTWISDEKGSLIQMNKACRELFGLENEQLAIGKYNILKDEILKPQSFYPDIRAVYEQGNIARFEVQDYNIGKLQHVHLPSSKTISFKVTIFPIKDSEGKLISSVVQHEDTTQRRKAEEALAYQNKVTSTIANNATSCLFMMNEEGYCTFMNPAGEKMFGYTLEEISQKPLHYMIHHHRPDGRLYPKEECPIDRVLPQNFDIRAHEDVFFRKDGSSFPVSCAASPIFENGIPVATVIEVRDISGEREAKENLLRINEDLNRKNEELKRINVDLDNFVYTASHDLKAPIANMEGIVTVLAKKLADKLDPKEVTLLDMLTTMAAKLKGTIKDLTEITKVQKELEPEAEPIAFVSILKDVEADLQPIISESKAILTADLEVEEISYARKNLRSILYNLIINALKYRASDRQPLIYVQTQRQGSYILLSVKDNGLGIPDSQIHKLFTMFKRLHTHVEGSGIGLYITKRIIENNGGRIEVESEEGKGSTFRVYFRTVISEQ